MSKLGAAKQWPGRSTAGLLLPIRWWMDHCHHQCPLQNLTGALNLLNAFMGLLVGKEKALNKHGNGNGLGRTMRPGGHASQRGTLDVDGVLRKVGFL